VKWIKRDNVNTACSQEVISEPVSGSDRVTDDTSQLGSNANPSLPLTGSDNKKGRRFVLLPRFISQELFPYALAIRRDRRAP
jgi:hypothetical protein